MPKLTAEQERLCEESRWDFSDLSALYINCTLKRSPEVSHTQGLADLSIAIMERNGVAVETIRAVDHEIATGVYPDMTEHGWERDDWPAISEKVLAADILVLTSPIWLGEKSSVCTQVIERLYGNSHILNEDGPVRLLRARGRLPDHRQRGRRQALRDEHPLLAAAPGLRDPAAGRLGVAGRGGPRPELPGPGLGRAGQRLHQPQHDVPDLEPAAHGADAQGRRRASRPTATSARRGTRAAASTSPNPDYR